MLDYFGLPSSVEELKEDEYRDEEGFKCCSKCSTRRECVEEAFGSTKLPILCKCQAEEVEQEQKEEEEAERKERHKLRILNSGIRGRYENIVIDDMRETVENKNALWLGRGYVKRFRLDIQTLILTGSVGTGKTMLACAIANELMALGRTVRFYSVTEIANMPMGFEYEYRRDKFNRDLERVSLVIFDDLGAERVTSTAREKVFDAIYRRYETGKPMIVTTNMSEKALKSPKGIEEERMLDRILHGAIVSDMGSISERR